MVCQQIDVIAPRVLRVYPTERPHPKARHILSHFPAVGAQACMNSRIVKDLHESESPACTDRHAYMQTLLGQRYDVLSLGDS